MFEPLDDLQPAPEGRISSDYPGAPPPTLTTRAWDRLARTLSHPRLGLALVAISIVLSSSALFLDFYLDDFIGRYIYSADMEGATRLFDNYSGGFGLAIGDVAENRWQMEAGWAPWWHYDQLRLALFRPIGVLVHALDFRFFRDNAMLMHAHNLLWLGALIAAVTFLYRIVLGPLIGGAAALLFAFDHTHGYAVGHICNRHALIGTMFGALCLAFYVRQRREPRLRDALLGPTFFVLGLLTSESTVSIAAYVIAYALFVERGSWQKRVLGVLPYVTTTLVWRALYTRAGFGAFGSGVYIDMGREPIPFAKAFLERGPVLWLGQFLSPPAETYIVLPDAGMRAMLLLALAVLGLSVWALYPLLKRDRLARFWALGLVGSLVPAAATFPHNRQLIFASLGAMGLLAQLFHYYAAVELVPAGGAARWARRFGIVLIAFHLVASPFWLPLTTASVALTAPMHRGAATVGDEAAGREAVFVTAPEFFSVRIVQLLKRLEGKPLPKTFRALSCEPWPVRVKRTAPNALEVHYEKGLLSKPMTDDLHRDRRLAMPAGTKVDLSDFHAEVLHARDDGMPDVVRFTFDVALEDPSLVFYRWDADKFVQFTPPAMGEQVELPGAEAPLAL
ncbi:MAG: hypothetical protein ABW252_18460 [Polyangiales bacterium]